MSCILSSRSPKESNINLYKFRLLFFFFFFCFSLVRLMPSAGCFCKWTTKWSRACPVAFGCPMCRKKNRRSYLECEKVDGCRSRRSYIRSCWCSQRCHLQGFCCQRKTYSLGAVMWHTCARQSQDLGFDTPYPALSVKRIGPDSGAIHKVDWTPLAQKHLADRKVFCTLTLPRVIGPRSAACYMMQLFIAKEADCPWQGHLGCHSVCACDHSQSRQGKDFEGQIWHTPHWQSVAFSQGEGAWQSASESRHQGNSCTHSSRAVWMLVSRPQFLGVYRTLGHEAHDWVPVQKKHYRMWLRQNKTVCLRALQKSAFLCHIILYVTSLETSMRSKIASTASPSTLPLAIFNDNRLVLLTLCTCAHPQGKLSCPSSSRHVLNHLVVAFGAFLGG